MTFFHLFRIWFLSTRLNGFYCEVEKLNTPGHFVFMNTRQITNYWIQHELDTNLLIRLGRAI